MLKQKRQNLLRDYICFRIQQYQVALLRRMADNLEQGSLESQELVKFVGTIDDDIQCPY